MLLFAIQGFARWCFWTILFLIFIIFIPKLGEMIEFDEHLLFQMGGNPNHQLGELESGYITPNIIGKLTHQRVQVGFSHFAAENFLQFWHKTKAPRDDQSTAESTCLVTWVFFHPVASKGNFNGTRIPKQGRGHFGGWGEYSRENDWNFIWLLHPIGERSTKNHGGFRKHFFALLHNLGWIHKPYQEFHV